MQIVNATDPTPLPVGTYNAFQSLYPGFTTTNPTNNVSESWLGSSSTQNGLTLSFSVVKVWRTLHTALWHFP